MNKSPKILTQVWERAPGYWVARIVVDGNASVTEYRSLELAKAHLEQMTAFYRRDFAGCAALEEKIDTIIGRKRPERRAGDPLYVSCGRCGWTHQLPGSCTNPDCIKRNIVAR